MLALLRIPRRGFPLIPWSKCDLYKLSALNKYRYRYVIIMTVHTYKLYRGGNGVYSIQLSYNGDGCFDVNALLLHAAEVFVARVYEDI